LGRPALVRRRFEVAHWVEHLQRYGLTYEDIAEFFEEGTDPQKSALWERIGKRWRTLALRAEQEGGLKWPGESAWQELVRMRRAGIEERVLTQSAYLHAEGKHGASILLILRDPLLIHRAVAFARRYWTSGDPGFLRVRAGRASCQPGRRPR